MDIRKMLLNLIKREKCLSDMKKALKEYKKLSNQNLIIAYLR